MVVGTSAGTVKVLRLTGPLGQLDSVDCEGQMQLLQAAIEANMSKAEIKK